MCVYVCDAYAGVRRCTHPLQRPEENVGCLHLLLPHLTTLKQGLSLNWKLACLARSLTREFLGSASLHLHRPVLELQTHMTVPDFLRGCWGFELSVLAQQVLLHTQPSLQPSSRVLMSIPPPPGGDCWPPFGMASSSAYILTGSCWMWTSGFCLPGS